LQFDRFLLMINFGRRPIIDYQSITINIIRRLILIAYSNQWKLNYKKKFWVWLLLIAYIVAWITVFYWHRLVTQIIFVLSQVMLIKWLTTFVFNGFIKSFYLHIACITFTIINKITRAEMTDRDILGFTSFFASLWHWKKLRPE